MTAKNKNWLVVTLFLVVLSVIFLPDAMSNKSKSLVIYFMRLPFYVSDVSSRDLAGILQYKGILKENKDLKGKLAKIQHEARSADELFYENQRLRDLLDYKNSLAFETVACRVIGRDPSIWRNTFLIDKGLKDGIKEGAGVIYFGGLAGKVIEVQGSYSRVMLITDPVSKIVVKAQRTREEAILEGLYDGLCRLKYLPLDSKAVIGDVLVTSALSSVYPQGIYIGKIVRIDYDPSYTHKTAIVKPDYSLTNLEDVLCLKELR